MGKRITRNRPLTDAEKAEYGRVREQIAEELPDIKRRGQAAKQRILLKQVLKGLKEERHRQGLSLRALNERTGIDRGSLSKLENDPDPNVTVNTLMKYAEAVGKTITVNLEDA
jgi:DNA-binding Xre family transcriptional regulator